MTIPAKSLKSGFFGPQRGNVRPPQSPTGKCGMVWVWVLDHPQSNHDDCLSWGAANRLNKSNVSQEYYRCRRWQKLGEEQEKAPNITQQHHDDSLAMQVLADLEALSEEESGTEGGKKEKLIAYFERNPALRTAAITFHGKTCKVCGFNFEAAYGKHGKNYIEVHHLNPISTLPEPSSINPRIDLAVLCSNCHRMIHRKRDSPLSIEELRNILVKKGSDIAPDA